MEKEQLNNVSLFERDSIGTIRTSIDEFGRPVFCLKDVCNILEIKNVSDAKSRLRSDGVVKLTRQSNGGNQNYLYITEGNLYKLIFQSRKESAVQFMDWVTEDILPKIRRYGKYDVQMITTNTESAVSCLDNYNELKVKLAILERQQEETREVKIYVKRALDSGTLVDLYDVPAVINMKGVGIAELLAILRAQLIFTDDNFPFQEYQDKGWFRVDNHSYTDKSGGMVTHKRTFCYKKGINHIRKILEDYAGRKEED